MYHDGDLVLEIRLGGRNWPSSLFRWSSAENRFSVARKMGFIPTFAQSFDELNGGDQTVARQQALARSGVSVSPLGYSPHGQGGSHAQSYAVMSAT